MTMRAHISFWFAASILLLLAVWGLRDVLAPFVVGGAVAYLLGPVIKKMVSVGVPRTVSALILLSLFIFVVVGLAVLILPLAYREAAQLAQDMPRYVEWLQAHAVPYVTTVQERFNLGDASSIQDSLKNNIGQIFKVGGDVIGRMISGTQTLVGALTFMILMPMAAFFMMQDWVRLTRWIDDMIPRDHYETVRQILGDIDRKIAGFVRGQLMVALILGIIYAIGLTLAGLKFGFLIGLVAGVLSVVPMLGSGIGLVLSVGVAWFQTGDVTYTGLIALFFIVVQAIESNLITPRIMGESVGLHPLWIIFSLVAGGSLFGITGMFLAVPVAAVIGVLSVFAIAQYKASPYYAMRSLPVPQHNPSEE